MCCHQIKKILQSNCRNVQSNMETEPIIIQTAKHRIIGSVAVMMGMLLAGLNEVVIKMYLEVSLIQKLTARFAIQLLIAVLWWNIKKPTKSRLFAVLNQNNIPKIHNWYGDEPYILNIWTRGILYGMSEICLYISLMLLPIGDAESIVYHSPLIAVYMASIWLKEKLPSIYILIPSTLLVIFGIIIMSQPTFLLSTLGVLQRCFLHWVGHFHRY